MTFVAVVAVLWRMRRGIDFTDEAFYLSLAHRFALGDKPFVDELNIAQTASLLLYPLVKLHVLVRGTTGIFLFIRIVYVLFFGSVGWAAYAVGARRLPRHTALLAGSPAIAFIPYGIPGLSYNTLSSGLLAIGLFMLAGALLAPPDEPPRFLRDRLTWSGFALGAATFAYPSLVVSAGVGTVAVFVLASGRRVVSALRVALGGGMFALLVSPVFLLAGRRHLQEVIAYSGGGMPMTTAKLHTVWTQFVAMHPEWPFMVVVVAIAMAVARKWPRLIVLGLPLIPLLAKGSPVPGTGTALAYVSSFALLAPVIGFALRDTRFALTLVVGVWVPSASAGAIAAWSSSNGAIAAGLGLFPAALVTGLLLAKWITELTRPFHTNTLRVMFGFAPVVVLHTMVKIALADDAVYRDGQLPLLGAKVTDGPYKGIYTTSERQRSLARMSADIQNLATTSHALFYYDFPAGYLIASRRPLVPSTWIFAMEPRLSMDADRFSLLASPGDVVFRVGSMQSSNPLDRNVKARCESLGSREGYAVWRVR